MTLADRFIAAKGEAIEHDGHPAFWTHWIPVDTDDVIRIRLVDYIDEPLQGVGLHADKCQLEVRDVVAKNLSIWADNAPEQGDIQIVKAKKGAKVALFNIWRDPKYGSTMARLGNAAMRVEQREDGWRVRCADGWGEADFKDLVFDVQVVKAK